MAITRKFPSLRITTVMAVAFGILVVGSAYLKTRHLRSVAESVAWQAPSFELPRAGFSRDAALADEACPDEDARSALMAAMADYAHGRDGEAQRSLLRSVAGAPEWPMARFYLGVVRLHLGFPTSAAEDLRRARSAGFEPAGDSSAWWLGVAELYCGRTEAGRFLLEEDQSAGSPRAALSHEILERLERLDQENG